MNTRDKWNSKYMERIDQLAEPSPNPRLINLSAYLNGGSALDLACGLGANSLYLARMNYQVQAMDISDVAINYIQEQSSKHHLNIQSSVSDLTDLRKLEELNGSFDLVVISYYLDQSLFPIMKRLLKENGYFFMETFYQTPFNENQGVSSQYKLLSKELLGEFGDWNILYFEEHEEEGRQTIFCQKPF